MSLAKRSDDPTLNRYSMIALIFQFIYSYTGLLIGLVCVIGGIILSISGITGSITWVSEFTGARNEVTDAAPGVILFLVGVVITFFTRFRVG